MKKQTDYKKNTIPRKIKRKQAHIGLPRAVKFIPALLLFGISLVISLGPSLAVAKSGGVLGYATSTDVGGLLSGTNSQRAANGVAALSLNTALNNAAQAKANDMVTRDYWSHNTPDGQEPWVFFTQAGYNYKAAGENLAYGFATSSDTITGWMNSPPHKDNLLKTSFLDVGFGIANSTNYVGNGEQTVVVAMYGAQMSAAPPPSAPAVTQPQVVQQSTAKAAPVTTPAAAEPIETVPVTVPEPAPADTAPTTPASTEETPTIPATAKPTEVRRIQVLTGGDAAWSATLLSFSLASVAILWLAHHGLRLRRLIMEGEHFVLHRLHFDITLIAVLTLGWALLSSSGVVR